MHCTPEQAHTTLTPLTASSFSRYIQKELDA